jgi:hypothetical protein
MINEKRSKHIDMKQHHGSLVANKKKYIFPIYYICDKQLSLVIFLLTTTSLFHHSNVIFDD